jgi:hypothetical protein
MILYASAAGSERVPAEAVAAARAHLQEAIERGKQDPAHFEQRWAVKGLTEFSALRITEPYENYQLADQMIFEFADSTNWEFGHGARFLGYYFPVLYGTEYIVTLGINNVDGVWAWRGGRLKTANWIDPFVLRVQEAFPSTKGYRVSTIYTGGFGAYVLLYENDKLVKLSQMFPDTQSFFGFPANAQGADSLISIDAVREKLRAAAIKYKERFDKTRR